MTRTLIRTHEDGLHVLQTEPVASSGEVLFIHGLGESGLCFQELFVHAALAAQHCVAPDLFGYGRSVWLPEPQTLQAVADELSEWIGRRGRGPMAIVGHSMGGVIGQLLSERHPGCVRVFVNVEGNISLSDCTFSSQAANDQLAKFLAGGMDRLLDSIYRAGLDRPALRGYYASMRLCDPRTFHLHSEELVRMSRAGDLGRRLAGLRMPHHYIAGAPWGTCAESLKMLREAGAEPVIFEPAGHWPFIDQLDGFARELAAMLEL